MLKKLFLLLFIVLSSRVNAQTLLTTIGSREYIPCEITLDDGSILNGFIKDFTLPKTFEFRGFGYDFSAIESKLKLDTKTFKYRKTLKGENEKVSLENVHSIFLKGSENIKYEKIRLKTINSKNEVVDLNREIMIPLIREDEINLYGLRVYNCMNGNNCEMMYVIAYIKNKNQDYAYIPIDFNRINLFNIGKLDDKFLKSFEETGSDCAEFLTFIDEKRKSFENKTLKKESKEKYKKFKKEKKAKLKLIKGRKEKQKEEDILDTEYFLNLYIEFIDEYTSLCSE